MSGRRFKNVRGRRRKALRLFVAITLPVWLLPYVLWQYAGLLLGEL